ncbi:unnamed protein product [Clavelina lepadiformis]|uniref:Sulfotransferase n=1 Tax=Clavelina lepadiformis TaxID=159417 RepID=A0ABP0H3B3_CLALP
MSRTNSGHVKLKCLLLACISCCLIIFFYLQTGEVPKINFRTACWKPECFNTSEGFISYASPDHGLKATSKVAAIGRNGINSIEGPTLHSDTYTPTWVAVVAAKKCGSGALTYMLNGHPSIIYIPRKELGIDSTCNAKRYMANTIREFQITHPDPFAYILRENQCLWKGRAFEVLGEMKPHKIITMFCDPVHRVLSDYLQISLRQPENFQQFKKASLTDSIDLALKHLYAARKTMFEDEFASHVRKLAVQFPINHVVNIVSKGMYVYALMEYYKHYRKEDVLILNGKDMILRPWEVMDQVQIFLDLPERITRSDFYKNEKTGFYCFIRQNMQYCPSDEKSLTHSNDTVKPTLPPDYVIKLQKFFEPYNKKLFNLLGFKMDWKN